MEKLMYNGIWFIYSFIQDYCYIFKPCSLPPTVGLFVIIINQSINH